MTTLGNEYMQYPGTVKGLAEEIKSAMNDYFGKKITNERIKEIICWYASSQSDKLFSDGELNSTVTKIIGKKRTRLLLSLLNENNGGA